MPAGAASAPSNTQPADQPADAPYRLPQTVDPRTYRLTLEPDLAAATFTGEMEVDLVVNEATTEVVCNAAELTISNVTFVTSAGHTRPATVELDEAEERAAFHLTEPLPTGPTTL